MRTVSSVCATASLTALASVGLTVARREQHQDSRSRSPAAPNDMTTSVATYTNTTSFSSPPAALDAPFSLRPSRSRRYASEGDSHYAARSTRAASQKRHSSGLTPGPSFSGGMDQSLPRDGEKGASSNTSAPSTQWLRRLSTGLSTSRDSSRTPAVSRPASAAYTSGSQTLSHAGSTTPIFQTPPPLPPNKLVKRTASLRSANGTPSPGSGSRLPLPTFRRPATSHQRSATLQEQRSHPDRNGRMSLDGSTQGARDSQWRHYFIPRIASDDDSTTRRRHSTGIPNPIRRVYPDRKYTPTLVSAREFASTVAAELDDGLSEREDDMTATGNYAAPSTASSPFPPQEAHFEEATSPRRSFSIGDLLATGPQPLWRRPSSRKGRPWSSRSIRRSRPRVASEPQALMGNSLSNSVVSDSERPSKRRDLTDPHSSRRSIYSSCSSNNNNTSGSAAPPEAGAEIDLDLGSESPYVQYTPDGSLFPEVASRTQTPSPFEIGHRPLEALPLASSKAIRTSATHSEITSSVDSDSEYRSVGDNSTDYQSDTAYDSIQTQTTRSSFGRRGPHIEKIFDDSPPTFSSGRSTKLRDFLSDGQFSTGEHNGRYRHSTIEEEESVISTPVRSLRNKSVTSTPSAHPHASHIFSSSPPNMKIMPDPDEIDWDAPDGQDGDQGLGIRPHASSPGNGSPVSRSLALRFGPTLLPSTSRSANSTPQRNGLSPTDKTNLFDWSEHQPSPSHLNHSPPRPRTVHGKKDQEIRGSRPSGRRPTSGMHARSHSVPVVPDLDGKRHNVVANKFGTWGVGSKAVTEDWNDDFDFDEVPPLPPSHPQLDERRVDSGHEMFVPQAIREQQENVVANISLLREWGLLIEELKELRIRAVALDMLHGPYSQAWREVDAMIELADQESEENTLEPRRSPPSSPGFDYSAFEDTLAADVHSHGADQRSSASTSADMAEDSFKPQASQPATPVAPAVIATRPRKDSELVAQSVIAALQSKRNGSDLTPMQAGGNRKVPFDTATLRHIVPYVSGLKWQVKDALRETEGLYSSPHRRISPDRQKAKLPHNGAIATYDDFTMTMQPRRVRAETDHDGTESPFFDHEGSLTNRMQRMELPP